MPEIPEIYNRAAEMNTALTGKTISSIEILQPKCLNLPADEFVHALAGAQIKSVTYRGKWLKVETSQGWLLLNMGMGGEILLVTRETLPAKHRLIFDFTDQTCLAVNFWWFGYAHYVPMDGLSSHELTSKLGPNALDLDAEKLTTLFQGQRSRIKSFLLDQDRIAGIGNAYIHDILFLARIHPLRTINTLRDEEIISLAKAIQDGLLPSFNKGGAFYEINLHGEKGGFMFENIIIGYREGQPCPSCGTTIQKIKTGSTSSFICPNCQVLPIT